MNTYTSILTLMLLINGTIGISLRASEAPREWENRHHHTSLVRWCQELRPNWPSSNLFEELVDKEVPPHVIRRSPDCHELLDYLVQIKKIKLDYTTTKFPKFSFEQLRYLPLLKELHLLNFPKDKLDLHSIGGLDLDKLVLENVNLRSLTSLSKNRVKILSVKKNPLTHLKGADQLVGLRSLDISNTLVKSLRDLRNLNILELYASGVNTSFLLDLNSLNKLEVLDLRNTVIHSFLSSLNNFKSLKKLWLTGSSQRLNLTQFRNLELLSLSDFRLEEIRFPTSFAKLEQIHLGDCGIESLSFLNSAYKLRRANLSSNRISDLSIFQKRPFPNLTHLNLSINPILNLSPLRGLKRLEVLELYRTPIQRNLIPRYEQNCPTRNSPQALSSFCSQ